jgi:hypothetical protein
LVADFEPKGFYFLAWAGFFMVALGRRDDWQPALLR